MSRLMRVDEYISTRYSPNSKPCKRTVIKLIAEGQLPGKRIGRIYYVNVETEQHLTGDPLVDSVLTGSFGH